MLELLDSNTDKSKQYTLPFNVEIINIFFSKQSTITSLIKSSILSIHDEL